MRSGRILILLALFVLLAVLVGFLVLRGIGGGTPSGGEVTTEGTPAPIRDANIVIAAQDIPRGAIIPSDAVILSPFPADYVVETMITDTAVVVGRRARMDIGRGVPVTENMITEQAGDVVATGSDAAFSIPPGLTAISIPMNRLSGVAFALQDGDQVDVLVTVLIVDVDPDFQSVLPNETGMLVGPDGSLLGAVGGRKLDIEPGVITLSDEVPPPLGRLDTEDASGQSIYVLPSETQRPRLVTQRLISYATVLHVGTFPLEEETTTPQAATDEGVGAPADQQQAQGVATPVAPAEPDIVTLIVNPQDALALNWAIKAGLDLVLTLRAPGDATVTDTSSVTLQYLVENYNILIPGKPPYGISPRLDEPIVPDAAQQNSPNE